MRSDPLKKGINAAPQRALLKALGLCDAEIERPLIGVVSSQNDIVPGHVFLDKITDAVKQGVALGGGVPIVFPAIAVCDGLAMGHKGMKYSLVSRELIADSVEAMATAHPFDGLVMVAACDKNVPGLLMAAARLNIPSIVISGGAMLAGRACGRKLSYSDISEGVSRFRTGQIDAKTFLELENKSCPTCGSCSGMFTANSMNCLTEVLGMALPGNGTIPAVMSARYRLAKEAGLAVMELVRNNVCPRDIMTKEAFENALTVDMALGCSTNSMLHLPAIAHECGFELDLTEANAISARTPNLCHLAPAGHRYIEELDEAGGIPAVMNELARAGLLHTNLPTVTGKTVGENIEGREILDAEVIRPVSDPFSKEGGIAVLKGNVAPDGCVVKRSAVAPEMLVHTGPGPRLRLRGGCARGHLRRPHQSRRRRRDPLRRSKGRSRHARDAQPDLRHHGLGPRRMRRAHHRRPFLGRNSRRRHWPRLARGRRGRSDRTPRGRRHAHDRHPREHHQRRPHRRGARPTQGRLEAPRPAHHDGLPRPLRQARDLGHERRRARMTDAVRAPSGVHE